MIDTLSLLVTRLVIRIKQANISNNQLGDTGSNLTSLSIQALWENRYNLDWLVHVSVDGTYFRIEEQTPWSFS